MIHAAAHTQHEVYRCFGGQAQRAHRIVVAQLLASPDDALLVDGPLPLDLLDARMDRWIAEQKAKPAT